MRVDKGWPPALKYDLPKLQNEQDQAGIQFHAMMINTLLSKPKVQERLYDFCREARDLDVETFRKWIVLHELTNEMEELDISEGEIRDVIIESVRLGGRYFT